MSGEWTLWDSPDAWSRPRRWRPGQLDLPSARIEEPPTEAEQVDRYGLALNLYGRFPLSVRHFCNIALEYLRIPKDVPPQQVGFGTVPELVFYGLLLDAGYRPARNGFLGRSTRSFLFQSRLLGGRVPGGAVSDFVVFTARRSVAVRVQSVFHDERNPFGSGGAKSEEDRRQRIRLVSTNYISAVVDVNRPDDGLPLEQGPWVRITNDLRRVVTA